MVRCEAHEWYDVMKCPGCEIEELRAEIEAKKAQCDYLRDESRKRIEQLIEDRQLVINENERLTAEIEAKDAELAGVRGKLTCSRVDVTVLKSQLAELKEKGTPGVMHEVDQAFYDLTIKERDIARAQLAEAKEVAKPAP